MKKRVGSRDQRNILNGDVFTSSISYSIDLFFFSARYIINNNSNAIEYGCTNGKFAESVFIRICEYSQGGCEYMESY